MRRFFLTILSIAALSAGAAAAQAPVKQDPAEALNPGKTTVLDCLTVLAGLEEIDGKRQVVVNQGKPNEQVIELPYEFGDGTFRLNLSRSITALRPVRQNQQDVAQKEMASISKGRGEIRDSGKQPGSAEFAEEHAEYLRLSQEFDRRMKEVTGAACSLDAVVRVKASELKLGKNEIRAGALSNIDKVFDRDK